MPVAKIAPIWYLQCRVNVTKGALSAMTCIDKSLNNGEGRLGNGDKNERDSGRRVDTGRDLGDLGGKDNGRGSKEKKGEGDKAQN